MHVCVYVYVRVRVRVRVCVCEMERCITLTSSKVSECNYRWWVCLYSFSFSFPLNASILCITHWTVSVCMAFNILLSYPPNLYVTHSSPLSDSLLPSVFCLCLIVSSVCLYVCLCLTVIYLSQSLSLSVLGFFRRWEYCLRMRWLENRSSSHKALPTEGISRF